MIITAKFNSTCPACGNYINQGTRVSWEPGQKARHLDCAGAQPVSLKGVIVNDWVARRRAERSAVGQQRQSLSGSYRNAFGRRERDLYPEEDVYNPRWNAENRDEAEYHQGLAEDRRYTAEVKAYGREMADRFAMEDEMTRFWKNGEDY